MRVVTQMVTRRWRTQFRAVVRWAGRALPGVGWRKRRGAYAHCEVAGGEPGNSPRMSRTALRLGLAAPRGTLRVRYA